MEIHEIRRQIDGLDEQILELLNRRVALALQIGELKRLQGRPIRVPDREAQVLARLSSRTPGPLSPEAVVRIFSRIIEESRSLEGLGSGREEP
ncbi:MAG: chorismate mutase [Candidatus Tectomicrobia bacterium]|nr:chorismate mutase [Candidatus Tectomicrobia bacterium]